MKVHISNNSLLQEFKHYKIFEKILSIFKDANAKP
jgi:hypothetical protein